MEKEIFVWREATYRVRAGKGSFYPLWSENGFEAWRKFRAEKRLARLRIILSIIVMMAMVFISTMIIIICMFMEMCWH